MSTIVCQNLVSCYESQLHMETTATLKLKVAPPAAVDFFKKIVTHDHHPPAEVKKSNLDNFGNWGFLEANNIPKETGDTKKDINSYTHPSVKTSSFSRLSPKSLQLCTENLGSETGTDIITDSSSIFSSSSSASPPSSPTSENSMSTHKNDNSEQIKINSLRGPYQRESISCQKTKSFPPPLTTMSGSSSLQVLRHREGGRLIIEAVEAPFRNSYLQAERSEGRLRLCFLSAGPPAARHGELEEDDEEEVVDECGGEMAAEEEEEEIKDPIMNELVESEKQEFDGEINLEVLEMDKFQRFRRSCKEGGHENRGFSSNWKPALWVATS